jgi:CRP-like cAMP-binding protein
MMNVIANDETVSCLIISEDGFDQLMGKSGEFRQRFSEKIPRRLM